ncbi:MAG: hypothetical protein Kow002_16740 [Anaerolineales bacterium]
MTKRMLFIGIAIVSLMVATLACSFGSDFIEDEYPVDDEEYYQEEPYQTEEPENEHAPAAGGSCPATISKVLAAATEFNENDDSGVREEQENVYIVTYTVSGNQISDPNFENVSNDLQEYQDDETTHQQIWEHFITLIPLRERESVLAEFSISTDGKDNSLAAVAQTTSDPARWALEVDIVDSNDTLNLTYTLIHEYAHLLTLGPDQVTPSLAIFNNPDDEDIYFNETSACPDYFPGEGCSQPNSYINAFFSRFWADIHEEWQDINLIEDDDAYYQALDNFYYDYEDRFLTDYAATNPEEDIAESFTFFVLSPRPAGNTIAEEKILFFYNYPELISLREQINNGICQITP